MRIDFPSPAQIPGLKALWKEAFFDPDDFIDLFFDTAFAPNRCRCATENGTVIAAHYWFDCVCYGKPIAYLYAVATANAYRHRGICTAMMADAHERLRAEGYSGALLVPGTDALGEFYGRMGYRYATTILEFSCDAALPPVSLRPVDAAEYGRLRRKYLPRGGVLQEGAALSFLENQAHLYAGSDLLLAARLDKGSLFALELLGNAHAAPQILSALGVRHGQFRTPGAGRNFAMYLPLDSAPAPEYFGFAFD